MTFFVDRERVGQAFAGKRVAIVGSGPGCLDNPAGLVDSHDVVVRVNQYKLQRGTGQRCDVYYSFYGGSIKRPTREELKRDGVTLCLAKCPNAALPIDSPWHRLNNKPHGVDFRYIYERRAGWWWCDTYVPALDEFMASFELLGGHIPSTGFSALLLVASCEPARIYLTGFDFFSSRVHNVNEPWRPGNPEDPIGHVPEVEREQLRLLMQRQPIALDARLAEIMKA